jgi:Ca2+-binding EF-hand superfamily protein
LEMIEEIDYVGNHKINYSEFLSATLSCQKFLTDELLWTLFKQFDIDDDNNISNANLR